ncbi:hypothetical protein KK083_30665 [Fulvivirgaceae bacterium PWU4]|uniref:Uncharacterized protein n=1 Tax=Chryseosolibacter histidini TaxID=2782349 RepID=A0AAP2DRM5_9BACT|nr:DUF6520 family protein [Chryseosolibacter histidini]MBT1701295.1 hypothetical protein [Chryseosolibacter histidini]
MKSIKLILPVIAFTIAIVSAVASDALLISARGINPNTSACVTGTLVDPPTGKTCNTSNTQVRCQVTISVSGVPTQVGAFTADGTCQSSEALFYNN